MARFHTLIWESQRSSRKHSSLQFSPSCSSWGCSLKWSKLVKKLEFSSFTLLGQSFCIVPAHGCCYIGQMLRASWASLTGSSGKSQQDSMCQHEAVQRGLWVMVSLFHSSESGLCKNLRELLKLKSSGFILKTSYSSKIDHFYGRGFCFVLFCFQLYKLHHLLCMLTSSCKMSLLSYKEIQKWYKWAHYFTSDLCLIS